MIKDFPPPSLLNFYIVHSSGDGENSRQTPGHARHI